jgi:ribosome biogenesis protein UTP30
VLGRMVWAFSAPLELTPYKLQSHNFVHFSLAHQTLKPSALSRPAAMAPPPQLPHPVSQETVASAVSALTKWMRKRAAEAPPNLLADERDDIVLLQLSLRRIPASSATRPRLLPLPHPVIAHADASICIISDDGPKSRSPAASDLLDKSKSLRFPVSEVIPLSTLRTDYRPYESRRRLAGSHDLFIADRTILPLLPRVLGKAFFRTKKAPIGVDFTRVGWPEQVRKVLDSSFLYLRTGTCSTIKVGRLDMKEEDIVENVTAAVEAAVEKVPKKWANVRALHLKALDSVALPIYQVVPQLGMKIEVQPVALLEGEVGTGEVFDAAEASKISKKKKKVLKDADGRVGEENSGKRKRDKKNLTEDVVMQEEIQAEPEKKKSKSILVPADDRQKVHKKGKRALEKEAEARQASKGDEKGRKSESALEKVSGKKEDAKHEFEDVADVANIKNKKGKNKEGKKKKSIKVEGDDCVESLDGKKSKGKKLDGDKIKNARTRVRV